MTSLECSPRRDCTPPPLLGFVPVSREELAEAGKFGFNLASKSFTSKGFGDDDSECKKQWISEFLQYKRIEGRNCETFKIDKQERNIPGSGLRASYES